MKTASKWMVRIGNKISKPMSSIEVKQHYKAGHVPPNAMLSRDGGKTWRTVDEVQRGAMASGIGAASGAQLGRQASGEKVNVVLSCTCGWQKELAVPKVSLGKQARCPKCNAVIAIPLTANSRSALRAAPIRLNPARAALQSSQCRTMEQLKSVSQILRFADLSIQLPIAAWVMIAVGLGNGVLFIASFISGIEASVVLRAWDLILTVGCIFIAGVGICNLVLRPRNSFLTMGVVFVAMAFANAITILLTLLFNTWGLVIQLPIGFIALCLQTYWGSELLRAHKMYSDRPDDANRGDPADLKTGDMATHVLEAARQDSGLPSGRLREQFQVGDESRKEEHCDCRLVLLPNELVIVSKSFSFFGTVRSWVIPRSGGVIDNQGGSITLQAVSGSGLTVHKSSELRNLIADWARGVPANSRTTPAAIAFDSLCNWLFGSHKVDAVKSEVQMTVNN